MTLRDILDNGMRLADLKADDLLALDTPLQPDILVKAVHQEIVRRLTYGPERSNELPLKGGA